MTDRPPVPGKRLKTVRVLLWLLVALAVFGTAALLLVRRVTVNPPEMQAAAPAAFGGPFTLVGANGKPFSTARLAGKPYAIFFGFTRCGDVCPTTLSRLVKLRRAAASDAALNIVFVTIDPEHDGPKEVGQYADLFGAPIIGLTGSPEAIDKVKKQYGIYSEKVAHAAPGSSMTHTGTVLLFDAAGTFTGTITPDEPDSSALAKLKKLTA